MDTPPHPLSLAFAAWMDPALSDGSSHVWSPHSLATALALLAHGARGRTREQWEWVLGADPERCLAELDPAVADEPGLDLATANDIHVSADTPLRPGFRARFHGRADAAVHPADFAGDATGVRARINDDVARTTRGLVEHLLQPADVTPDTAMILVNVLWMKATWIQAFEVELTRDRPFHAPGGTHPVPTMHRTGSMPYAEANGWRMVTLAGRHGVSLDVLLPEDGHEAPGAADLAALYQRRRQEHVRLALPRFRTESRRELGKALLDLGATDLFDGDYGGISGSPLYLGEIIHQAVFRVDEKGAEGAAATAVAAPGSAAPETALTVTVDRPFRFVLRRRGAVLFLGRVTDPEDPVAPAERERWREAPRLRTLATPLHRRREPPR